VAVTREEHKNQDRDYAEHKTPRRLLFVTCCFDHTPFAEALFEYAWV
jgi:hypothetical protein